MNSNRLIPMLMIATGTGLFLFWTGFFLFDMVPENAPYCYRAYEHAFPFPDGVLASVLLYGGIGRLMGLRGTATASTAAAGALVFLGILDFSFNIQNGIYLLSTSDMILNGFINAWCVGFGVTILFEKQAAH